MGKNFRKTISSLTVISGIMFFFVFGIMTEIVSLNSLGSFLSTRKRNIIKNISLFGGMLLLIVRVMEQTLNVVVCACMDIARRILAREDPKKRRTSATNFTKKCHFRLSGSERPFSLYLLHCSFIR